MFNCGLTTRIGNLDLFVANYVNLDLRISSLKRNEKCVWKVFRLLGPWSSNGHNIFITTMGTVLFGRVGKSGVVCSRPRAGLGSVVSDFDNDGWPDIYVACDSTANILYHNAGRWNLHGHGAAELVAFNKDGKEQGGMGAAVGVLTDGDGHFDIVKTNFDGDTPTLYHNNGDGTFSITP